MHPDFLAMADRCCTLITNCETLLSRLEQDHPDAMTQLAQEEGMLISMFADGSIIEVYEDVLDRFHADLVILLGNLGDEHARLALRSKLTGLLDAADELELLDAGYRALAEAAADAQQNYDAEMVCNFIGQLEEQILAADSEQ